MGHVFLQWEPSFIVRIHASEWHSIFYPKWRKQLTFSSLYAHSWKEDISYLFWTFRMSSLGICHLFCPKRHALRLFLSYFSSTGQQIAIRITVHVCTSLYQSGNCNFKSFNPIWSKFIAYINTVGSQIETITSSGNTVNTIYIYMQVCWPLSNIEIN